MIRQIKTSETNLMPILAPLVAENFSNKENCLLLEQDDEIEALKDLIAKNHVRLSARPHNNSKSGGLILM